MEATLRDPARVLIGLHDPKSPINVDAVRRAAGNFAADGVLYSGQRYPLAVARNPAPRRVQRTVGAQVALQGVASLLEGRDQGMALVSVELVVGATPLPEFVHPARAFYLFGPEDGSLPQGLVDASDHVVYVPTRGCMNLAASVNVLLYDRLLKCGPAHPDGVEVAHNRDRNNRLRVCAPR